MPIKIEITAETPAELASWYERLAVGINVAATATVNLSSPSAQAVNDAIAAAIVESVAEDVAAGKPTANAMLNEVVAEQAKPRRGRAPKQEEPAKAAPLEGEVMGPDDAAKAVHEHVPPEHKPANEDEKFDEDACKGIMRQLAAKHGAEAPRALLAKFSVVRISVLDPSQHKGFVLAGREMLQLDKLVA